MGTGLRLPGRLKPQNHAAVLQGIGFKQHNCVGLLFLIGFVLAVDRIPYGELGLLSIIVALPVLLLVLSIAAGCILIRAWREKYWHKAERIFYSLVLAVSVAFLWSLNYWNLLGWKY
jgi:hypothetical protein